jgi:hypothetical protein
VNNDIPEGEELLRAFPEWGEKEETLWLEFFQELSLALISSRLDPESEDFRGLEDSAKFELFKGDLLMAAELADSAIEEVQSRLEVQNQHKQSETKKRLNAIARKRRARRERAGK